MNRFDTSWKKWTDELRRLYAEYYPPNELSMMDCNDWRDYYEEGFSPKDALFDEARS